MPDKSTFEKLFMKFIHPIRYDMGNDHLHVYKEIGRRMFPNDDFPMGVTFNEKCACGKTREPYYMFDDLFDNSFYI